MTEMDSTALGALMNMAAPKSGQKQTPEGGEPSQEFLHFLEDPAPVVSPLSGETAEGEVVEPEAAIAQTDEEQRAIRIVDIEPALLPNTLPAAKSDGPDAATDRGSKGILASIVEGQQKSHTPVFVADLPKGADPAKPQLANIPPLQADAKDGQAPGLLQAKTRAAPQAAVHPQDRSIQVQKDSPAMARLGRPFDHVDPARPNPTPTQGHPATPVPVSAIDTVTTQPVVSEARPAPKVDEAVFVPRERATRGLRADEPMPPRTLQPETGRTTGNPSPQVQITKAVANEASNAPLPINDDLPSPIVSGASLSDSGRSGAISPLPTGSLVISQPAQTAGQVAAQMAVAVSQNRAGTTQITLSPEELGKVRMVMSVQDAVITMTVHAERIEVGDLLRRHIDTLADEFREMGFEDVTFSFDQDGEPAADERDQEMIFRHIPAEDIEVSEVPATGRLIVGTAGLDVRI